MVSRGFLLLDVLELIISIIGIIVFSFLLISASNNQKLIFIISIIYLIYNCYCKTRLLNIFKRNNRIIKYYGRKVNL